VSVSEDVVNRGTASSLLILAADGSASAILLESINLKNLGAPKSLFGRRDRTDETFHIFGMDSHPYSV